MRNKSRLLFRVGVGWVHGVWCRFPTVVIIRLSQPSLAGVGAGAELDNYLSSELRLNLELICNEIASHRGFNLNCSVIFEVLR